MRDPIRSVSYLILLVMVCLCIPSTLAQETQSLNDQTRLIRIKKIANEWQGSVLSLHTREGETFSGILVEVSGGNYRMEMGGDEVMIPLEDVIMVSFDPGLPELFLSFASSIMGAGILGGAMMLVDSDAKSGSVGVAALLGFLGGGLWGYSSFYESEVIHLE